MASQVFSGPSNFSYTNNTVQNVRVIINYMESSAADIRATSPGSRAGNYRFSMSWAGVSLSWSSVRVQFGGNKTVIGKNIAFIGDSGNFVDFSRSQDSQLPAGYPVFPTEVMLAPGQTFTTVCGIYNVVVIPENG